MYKRPLLIGLFGLILGTGAEAHSIFVGGRWVAHSIGCIGLLEQVFDLPQIVGCGVTTISIEVLCQRPDGTLVVVPSNAQVTLTADTQIGTDDITNKRRGTARVEVLVRDESLLKPEFCEKESQPIDVIIRKMKSQLSASGCVAKEGDPCSVKELRSTLDVDKCVLPRRFNFGDDFEDDDQARFACTIPVPKHLN